MTDSNQKPDEYIEASVDVPGVHADAVSNFIIDNICSGILLEEEEGSETTTIRFYVLDDKADDFIEPLSTYLAALEDPVLDPVPEIKSHRIISTNWEEQYRRSVAPVWITPDILVRPPWDNTAAPPKYDIIIEPKMAFGTGRHETTRSCLKVIGDKYPAGGRFVDLGCGSGILSILAAMKGASFIKAIDYDQLAVDNCIENFEINKVSTVYEVLHGSLEKCDGDEPYDFVAVNIIKETILPMLPRLRELTRPDGILLLAGLLARDEAIITAALEKVGLSRYTIEHDNEWITFIISG
ncbi:MAG TPA: 50S ribosomal protein L11 methyltransferase [candidate division Zixibacteria bacterium]|nr:50S ribosomal protein L11 methyltransferase [candidate division Zixibacteria bacterium]